MSVYMETKECKVVMNVNKKVQNNLSVTMHRIQTYLYNGRLLILSRIHIPQ